MPTNKEKINLETASLEEGTKYMNQACQDFFNRVNQKEEKEKYRHWHREGFFSKAKEGTPLMKRQPCSYNTFSYKPPR
ncbi:MAG: hypothetical protein EPO11_03135 [Gammaproteobacteria bacterium]|nr:MAG: hypothetical protein EPO11_03135 [Gammaproteobacteria bacterium]